MIDIKNTEEVLEHLEKHGNSPVTIASTIKDGYVSCIGPVKTICGPEFMCSSKTSYALEDFVRNWRFRSSKIRL
jgi:hypothetical protein